MPGFYGGPHSKPTSPGDAGAIRHCAGQLRKAARSLQSISDDADSWVYFYAEQWDGRWRDQFLSMWDESITASAQLNSSAWAQARTDFVSAHPQIARLYDANSAPSQGAFRVAIDACNQMAGCLDQYAHAVDQEVAQEWEIFLDVLIIGASILVTALSFGALGPEAMLVDFFLVGATIGGATSAAIDFTNQTVDNTMVNHDSFFGSFGHLDLQELASAYITGYVVGGVSSVVGMGLPRMLTGMGGVFKAAVGNTTLRIGIDAVGFGAGTFVGDLTAQQYLDLLTKGQPGPADWGTAGSDALFAAGGGVLLGTVFHGLHAPETVAAADPAEPRLGMAINTFDEGGQRVTYLADWNPGSGQFDVTRLRTVGITEDVGAARLVDGTFLVDPEGRFRIDLSAPGTDVLVKTPSTASWIRVGKDGTPDIVREVGISDGRIGFNVVRGEGPLHPDLQIDPHGELTVPKTWLFDSQPRGGVLKLTDPSSGESFRFTFGDPSVRSTGAVGPKLLAGPASGGGEPAIVPAGRLADGLTVLDSLDVPRSLPGHPAPVPIAGPELGRGTEPGLRVVPLPVDRPGAPVPSQPARGGDSPVASGPPPAPLTPSGPELLRARVTGAAEDVLRAGQVEERERLWREQQQLLAQASPAERELVRAQYAEARRLLVQQQELETVGLRILALCTEWDPYKGGVVAVNRNLCLGLAEAGHDVYCRVGHEVAAGEGEGRVHVIGPRVYNPGIDERDQLVSDAAGMPAEVDVVIGHSRFSGPAALEVRDGRYPHARLVHVVHMVTDALGRVQGRPEKGLENQAIERRMVGEADLAVGVGPVLYDEVQRLAAMSGTSPAFHELDPGVDIVERLPRPSGERTPNVLLFGRADDAQKGAAEAAMMIRELGKDVDVRLTVRGAPPETVERAKRMLSQLAGREVDVKPYTIDRAEILADLQEADVVIMPSRAEGFGLVGLEAAGAGVPILVPNTSGIGRFVSDPSRFPADVGQRSVVEQGFEEPVPVARWVDRLREVLGDLPAAQERALTLQRLLREANTTWKGAAQSLVAAIESLAERLAPALPPDDGEPPAQAAHG